MSKSAKQCHVANEESNARQPTEARMSAQCQQSGHWSDRKGGKAQRSDMTAVKLRQSIGKAARRHGSSKGRSDIRQFGVSWGIRSRRHSNSRLRRIGSGRKKLRELLCIQILRIAITIPLTLQIQPDN